MGYRLTANDLAKRRGDRRQMVLQALANVAAKAARDKKGETAPTLTPAALAARMGLHPTTTYRCLERLRKAKCVERAGWGVQGEYQITEKGRQRLEWLKKHPR